MITELLEKLEIRKPHYNVSIGKLNWISNTANYVITSPVNGESIGEVALSDASDYSKIITAAKKAFPIWSDKTAPERGEIIRQLGEALRLRKESLGQLVSFEMGKSLQEGCGEVQEMIDICDFAVGLSRQLYGLQMHSERPNHRMFEQWHPLGIVGIISAFNFPVAVWAWNTAIALVCGNVVVWKPSEKTPFSSMACQNILAEILEKNNLPDGISNLVIGNSHIGALMASDTNVDLISATGSTTMGKSVAETVGRRLGKSILELGGNNAIIVTENADLSHAIPAIVFGAVGTAGQRCTSTRRLLIHSSLFEELKEKLVDAYDQIRIGNPLNEENHMGPLIDQKAVHSFLITLEKAKKQGGEILSGGQVLEGEAYTSGCYVQPTLVQVNVKMPIVQQETFAPILYIMSYTRLEDAIQIQNNVPQGLSSAIFTLNIRESEYFLSHKGSDCGIANVNIGTSGAEIGGAFGGEKETGGGRESGSDAWKAYMRRQTCTLNYSADLPLAQGIKFKLY